MAVAVLLAAGPRTAAVEPPGLEQVLVERFGFSTAEVEQVRGGQLLTRSLPAGEGEIAVLGVVRIPDDRERLLRWIRDIEDFRKQADLGTAQRIGATPTLADFARLELDSGELAVLRKCQPGDCALRLGDAAIARFQAEVEWSAADAGPRATRLARQLLLEYAEAYLRGGDEALGAAHDQRRPRQVADAYRALTRSATNLYALAGPLATYLERFPRAALPGAEQFLYWAKGGAGADASITLHHLVIHRQAGGGILVADKQIYASRYTDAAVLLLWLEAPADGRGYYLVGGMRAHSPLLEGLGARLLRTRIEEESRSYTQIYLDWIRKSLAPGS